VRSTFDLPAEQRAAIQNALNETFSAEVRVQFETAADLISGVELTTNGQKVAWSIADYLASLEKGVDELLKEKDKPEAKPEAESKPEAQVEAKPKPEVQAGAKPKPEPASKPEAQVEAKPKPEVQAEAKPKPEPEEPKPGTKSQ
jgi:F-type H+-transporting ATPase subunit b